MLFVYKDVWRRVNLHALKALDCDKDGGLETTSSWSGADPLHGEDQTTTAERWARRALSTGGLDKILTREATIRYMASFLICYFICSVCGGSSCDERSDKYWAQQACDLRGFFNAALLLSFKILKLWSGGSLWLWHLADISNLGEGEPALVVDERVFMFLESLIPVFYDVTVVTHVMVSRMNRHGF